MKRIATYRLKDTPGWYCFRVVTVNSGGYIRFVHWEKTLFEPTKSELKKTINSLRVQAKLLNATITPNVDQLWEDCQED